MQEVTSSTLVFSTLRQAEPVLNRPVRLFLFASEKEEGIGVIYDILYRYAVDCGCRV